jgi:hypothetical protein
MTAEIKDPDASATERQRGYLSLLARTRDYSDASEKVLGWIRAALLGDPVSKGQASAAIAFLREAAEIPAARAPANPDPAREPGMYRHKGRLYRLQTGKKSGSLYAMLAIVEGSEEDGFAVKFSYSSGTVAEIRSADKLSAEEAGELGRLWKVCVDCGKDLTDNKRKGADGLTPVQRGIGPVCVNKY